MSSTTVNHDRPTVPANVARQTTILPALSIASREMKHFLRQRGRIIGALGTPVMFWLFIGAGIGSSFSVQALSGSENYLEYFFPGTLAMILLFTSLFSMISLIKERDEGFLQSVLVAPVSRQSIVLGKVLGCTALASIQGVLYLAAAPLLGIPLGVGQIFVLIALIVGIGFALSSLGFVFAWRSESIQSFHSIMNLVLFPLWLLSGALFPASGASPWLAWVIRLNPLSYGVAALRRTLVPAEALEGSELPGFALSVGVTAAFAVVAFVAATALVGRSRRGGVGLS